MKFRFKSLDMSIGIELKKLFTFFHKDIEFNQPYGDTLVFCNDRRLTHLASVVSEDRPQDAAFLHGDEKKNKCFVMYQYGMGWNKKSLYSYCSFADQREFANLLYEFKKVKIPYNGCCFFELIRENYACVEYYDIEWTLNPNDEIQDAEQHMFDALINALQKLRMVCESDMFRVLSASSRIADKGSLHVMGPQIFRDNHTHMPIFMSQLRDSLDGQDLQKAIDWGVYSRNRTFRCIWSYKRNDARQRIFIPAIWHKVQKDVSEMEFFISRPDIPVEIQLQKTMPFVRNIYYKKREKTTTFDDKHHLAPIYKKTFAECFEFNIVSESAVYLKRINSGICIVCRREHTSENAFIYLSKNRIFFKCYRDNKTICISESDQADTISQIKIPVKCIIPIDYHKTASIPISSAPAMCRWDKHICDIQTVGINSMVYIPSKFITHHIYCVDITMETVVSRSIDGQLSVVGDTQLATYVMSMCTKVKIPLKNITIRGKTWIHAINCGPLLGVEFTHEGVRSVAEIEIKEEIATPLDSASSAIKMQNYCKNGLVYTAFKFKVTKKRVNAEIEDDAGNKKVIFDTHCIIWQHFQQKSTMLRFVYREAPEACVIIPWL